MESPASQAPGAREPIAIVGIGCRFPGGVVDPRSFWRLLIDRQDAIAELPGDRLFDVDALYEPGARAPGKIATRWGGFLDQIDAFDASFFGISPREAERMDPQHRLLLEVAWEALEDAGVMVDALDGSRTGVFVGQWLADYEAHLLRDPDSVDFHMTLGTGRYSASGRISYAFGLQGPSLTLDTACSSSLVAVHLACQSLWAGESSLALAGGANVILQPQITIAYSQSGMMAPDGRCKFGDARANGYVRSEGAAIVALEPLSVAIANGHPVYAVVRGSAANNDGRSSGFLATPGRAGQEALLRTAYAHAGLDPGRVQYVEAHGTGTAAGDPVELGALGAVIGQARPHGRPCIVGSVKTNFGHTEGAAGVAGLIKTALALQHGQIPATLHFEQPNPSIAWSELGLAISSDAIELEQDGAPPLAGVSSFGIAGTNAHVVLEAVPAPVRRATEIQPGSPAPLLLPISARSETALRDLAARYQTLLTSPDVASAAEVCATAALKRDHHPRRLAVVGASGPDLAASLNDYLTTGVHRHVAEGAAREPAPRVAFVFPGQGGQWLGMGRELRAREPIFAAALDACERALDPHVDWKLSDVLESADTSWLERIDIVQPMLFAIQVALAELWRSWGVVADAVVGHSLGEVAAACVAGALSLDDAAHVIALRSRLLRRISGNGAMALVDIPPTEAERAIEHLSERVSVAVSNSPRSAVLAGDPAALEELRVQLEFESEFETTFWRWVNVDVASHSPQVEPLLADLEAGLAGLQPRQPDVPFYSTVTAARLDEVVCDAAYWCRNLRSQVQFGATTTRLADDGHTLFVELGPHPVLTTAIDETLGARATTVPSLRRDEPEPVTFLDGLAALYVRGVQIDWSRLAPHANQSRLLPRYAWQRQRFWLDPASSDAISRPTRRAQATPTPVEDLYQLTWQPAPVAAETVRDSRGTCVILVDGLGFAERVHAQLTAHGARAVVVDASRSADLRSMLADAGRVIDLRSLDAPATERTTSDTLRHSYLRAHTSATELVNALDGATARIWLVTRGAQHLPGDAGVGSVAQAVTWGLGQAVAEEHPEHWGGLVDLDPTADIGLAAQHLIEHILADDGEDQVAFRDGQRQVARLAPLAVLPAQPISLRSDASYLITGGAGVLGLALAERLVKHGARRLVLLGRSALPPRRTWSELDPHSLNGQRAAAILRLERLGASVHLAAVDVADEAQLRDFLDAFRAEAWPPIRGVVHAAVNFQARLLDRLDAAWVDPVAGPKILGAWLLHEQLADLDFFVNFSSLASFFPEPGLAVYAAGNAFLDAVAHHRRANGLPALSVNWGPWAGSNPGRDVQQWQRTLEQMARRGIGHLEAAGALDVLECLLGQDHPAQAVFASVNWGMLQSARASRLVSDLVGSAGDPTSEPQPVADPVGVRVLDQLCSADAADRLSVLEDYLRRTVGRILRLEPTLVEPQRPLGTLGLDSLMGVELRNVLEADLDVRLPASLVYNYPTIARLTPHLAERLGLGPASVEPHTPSSHAAPAAGARNSLSAIVELSDDEALAALVGHSTGH